MRRRGERLVIVQHEFFQEVCWEICRFVMYMARVLFSLIGTEK